jgi:uncharacterized protein (TIGR00369 family)
MSEHTTAIEATTLPAAVPVEAMRTLDGLTVLRRILTGDLPTPPIAALLPFSLVEVDPGRAVFEGRPDERLLNPMGSVHGGFAMTLLDSAMTCAVVTALAAGEGCTTIETKVNFVRALMPSSGPVRAEATLVHAGARVATAQGRLVDTRGRIYAHGTTTCLRFPV